MGNYDRKSREKKELKKTILIVCEGERTEPNYFNSFPIDYYGEIELDIKGKGYNTVSLVEWTKRHEEKQKREKK